MSEVISRAARAMVEAHGQWEIENNRFGGQCPWQEQHAELLVRTVLLAAREPTTHMLFEGVVAQDGAAEVQDVYTAMIQSALSEGTER